MTDLHCIIIPHYRHLEPLMAMLPRLSATGLPVYVVDDASGDDVVAALRAALSCWPALTLLMRERNGGKGAAMLTGLRQAASDGFTHALSMDADGQHAIDDIPRFLAHSRTAPDAIITGKPLFGDDIPPSRLHGRKLTNGLVRLVSGQPIADAMCGFRVYPIRCALDLCSHISYRTRMEFDVEIIVRAAWRGIAIHSLPTRVVYPEGGASHFHLFRDNVRLVAMHTLLIVEGLARRLLARPRRRQ
ncbi:MAG: glycosyltransferase family 2 protein [Pseudomonadales bacterium]